MKRLLPLLLAACATMPVTLEPIAAGRRVDASEFALRVDGTPAGRVLFSAGKVDGRVVRVGLTVENRGHETVRIEVPLASPSAVVARPGESRRAQLRLKLPPDRTPDRISGVTVHWRLVVGDAAPAERAINFVAQRGRQPVGAPDAADAFADIPLANSVEARIDPKRRVVF